VAQVPCNKRPKSNNTVSGKTDMPLVKLAPFEDLRFCVDPALLCDAVSQRARERSARVVAVRAPHPGRVSTLIDVLACQAQGNRNKGLRGHAL
jgi:hypothetical protein